MLTLFPNNRQDKEMGGNNTKSRKKAGQPKNFKIISILEMIHVIIIRNDEKLRFNKSSELFSVGFIIYMRTTT